MPEPSKDHTCPMMSKVQKMVRGKWKLLILWQLSIKTWRFNALHRVIPEISQRVLTQQLRELERDGLVSRKIYREVPPRVEYSLTSKGSTLTPLFDWLCSWGYKHLSPDKSRRKSS